jgi:hypothetical protein
VANGSADQIVAQSGSKTLEEAFITIARSNKTTTTITTTTAPSCKPSAVVSPRPSSKQEICLKA